MPPGPGPSSALKHLYPARARLGTGTLGPPSVVSGELHRLWADPLDLSRKDTESRGISPFTLRVSPVEGAPDRAKLQFMTGLDVSPERCPFLVAMSWSGPNHRIGLPPGHGAGPLAQEDARIEAQVMTGPGPHQNIATTFC